MGRALKLGFHCKCSFKIIDEEGLELLMSLSYPCNCPSPKHTAQPDCCYNRANVTLVDAMR